MASYTWEFAQRSRTGRSIRYAPGGTAADLTGYGARMHIRPSYSEAPIVELTTTNGRITLVPTASSGQPNILLALGANLVLAPGEYVSDLYLDPSGSEGDDSFQLLTMDVRIQPAATHP